MARHRPGAAFIGKAGALADSKCDMPKSFDIAFQNNDLLCMK
jgi:hypothetical protein